MAPSPSRPLRDLAGAILLTLAYAAWVVWRRHGEWADGLVPFQSRSVFYSAPVVAPLVLFVRERLRRPADRTPVRAAIDVAVILLAASRMWLPVPGVSGHALFLTYGLATSSTRVVRIAMAVVLAATAVVKIFVWHDLSLLGGALVALVAAGVWRRAVARRSG